jgi:hypothetical protein
MLRTAAALSIALLAGTPVAAEETPPVPGGEAEAAPGSGIEEGKSLIERGVRLLFEGLIGEMEPALRDMAGNLDRLAEHAEPMLRELARLMGDMANYHPPEVLPNGDILIRRRQPGEAPGPREPQFGPGGETEL